MTPAANLLPKKPPIPYVKPTAQNTNGGKTYRPTHGNLFRVEFQTDDQKRAGSDGRDASSSEETFSSRLIAMKDFPPHTTITSLTNLSQASTKAYSSVQYGPGEHEHFELNSDLLFLNHSCNPSVFLHLCSEPSKWKIKTGPAGLKKGEDLTFFYPSTEWDMAQGFDCSCGAPDCLEKIQGAKDLPLEQLGSRGYINDHIVQLKKEQRSRRSSRANSDA